MSKRYQIVAKFNQALVKHRVQTVSVEASNIPTALARGLREIMRRPGIKKVRHRALTISVVLSHAADASTDPLGSDA
ncbi:MAG: hypothetical protein AB1411_15680 [Nitrospirota bacterium]